LNPRDAISLGLADRDPVHVISPWGEVTVKVRLTEAVPAGLVCMEPGAAKRLQSAFEGSFTGWIDGAAVSKICRVRLEKTPETA